MTKLFREHRVYKAANDGLWVYDCMELLGKNRYAVQLATFFKSDDVREGLKQHDHYKVDFLADFIANPKIKWWRSLEIAIVKHDKDFGN